MKKRSAIVSLAMLLALPFGLVAGAGAASAEGPQCYSENSTGGLEPNGNFQDQESCETVAHGFWF